jgi:NAD(P)-dependent dehydrogenase (short-subunit alcohol dehydrogenase family)
MAKRNLRGRVVIITGASRGLGAAMACEFARCGARVALLARGVAALEKVAAQVRELGAETLIRPTDVTDWATVHGAINEIMGAWGRIDVLANVAAVDSDRTVVEQIERHVALEAMKTNYLGPLVCCQAVLPVMRRQRSGHLINVSSVLGKRATPFKGAYAASKAALNALTDTLRVETMGSGISVTLVCPGRIKEPTGLRSVVLTISADRAARRIVRCVHHPRREVVLTPAARALVFLNTWTPRLVDRILRRISGTA